MWERVTTKELKKRYGKVFLVESQKYEIFKLVEPDYCTYGIYGKNADYWDLGGVLFGTGVLFTDGDRPFHTDCASDSKELVDFLEKSNKEIADIDDYQAKKIHAIIALLEVYKLVQK